MARKLKPYEFYHNLAKKMGIEPDDWQNDWEIFVEFLIDELQRYGSIFLPNMGEMQAVQRGGKYVHMPIDNSEENRGKTQMVHIEPFLQVKFMPSDTFKEVLNGNRLPKAEIKRMRAEMKRKELAEQEAMKQIELAKKQEELIEKQRLKRLERIAKQKEMNKLSKKKQEEIKKQEEYDPYDYGRLEE